MFLSLSVDIAPRFPGALPQVSANVIERTVPSDPLYFSFALVFDVASMTISPLYCGSIDVSPNSGICP